ncbi:hypothetical protein Tco_1505545 [Tanacetum coccineum]
MKKLNIDEIIYYKEERVAPWLLQTMRFIRIQRTWLMSMVPRSPVLKPTTGCDKESDNSKENIDDSLEQHQMTDTKTSSFESPLKVDKD